MTLARLKELIVITPPSPPGHVWCNDEGDLARLRLAAELMKCAPALVAAAEALKEMEEGYRFRCNYCGGDLGICKGTPTGPKIPCRAKDARAALRAIEEALP